MRRMLLVGLLSGMSMAAHAGDLCADLAVVHARIHTMDPARPQASALAVAAGRVVRVGDEAQVRGATCARTRVIDAGGKLLLPGFNDSHVHFMGGGEGLSSVDLRDAASQAELVERIRRYVATLPKGEWVVAGNWDHERWTPNALPTPQLRGSYAFRSLLDAGVHLAFGTDWDVAPLDPMQGIYGAVTRRTLDGAHPGGWIREQKISVDEAVRAYTTGSAYAEFQEADKGMLKPWMLADLVLWSQDIYCIDPADIGKTRALLTVVDGKVVYEAK